jgi:outer membrane receptor for ferrienterochelin and colicins
MQIAGGEATVQARWSNGLSAKVAYCYTHEHNPDQAPNQFMPARPHSANYKVEYTPLLSGRYGLTVMLSGRWLGAVTNQEYRSTQHPEQGIMSVHYPSYHLHKLQVTQRWQDWLSVNFSIDNLLGYKPDNYFYNAPLTTGQAYSIGFSLDVDKLFD